MVYGASTAWPLAHLPNPAAHGPASTALGDSLKAEHHTPRQRKPNGDGDDGGSRPLKLLLAGESVVLGDRTASVRRLRRTCAEAASREGQNR